MNVIKGFALNRNFVDNTPGVVADIGELSPLGFSFNKEPRAYSSQTYPTISLIHFPTASSGVGTTAPIPDAQRDHILKVINNIYFKSASETRIIAPGEFVEYLLSQMGSEVADITVGGSVQSGTRSIIEWIQWRNPAVTDDNLNKVWFSNNSFVGQFDEYQITVIPTFEPVDLFFGQPADVKALIAQQTHAVIAEKIQAAKAGTNESFVWGKSYDYVNPVNALDRTPAPFTVLGYGMAADNIDIIKQAIVDYLLANSTHSRDEWKKILPDLFLRTEFYLFPQYENMAIENVVGGVNGVQSPVVTMTDVLTKMKADSFEYDAAHVEANAQVFAFPYMSVAVGAIGNIENRNGNMKITDWFPDYFFVAQTSSDFNRMSLLTQGWVKMLLAMMPIARDMTTASTVPVGYSRVIRGSKMYLSKSYNEIQFLLAAPVNP